MSKKTKLYVGVGRTLSKVENFPSVLIALPKGGDVTTHFELCRKMGEYRPVEVTVKPDEFSKMITEIRKRLGVKIGGTSIPIVLSSNTKPIIRILQEKIDNDENQ